LLKITHDDINNKVRNIQGPPEQWEVSPAIPYHAIGCSTLSTISDSSISTGLISERTSAENPLDILANQAAVMLEPASQCAMSMQLTLPNQCSYKECSAPLNLFQLLKIGPSTLSAGNHTKKAKPQKLSLARRSHEAI
jgi:hypothetical protein